MMPVEKEAAALIRTYVVVHYDAGDYAKVWFPDFPDLVVNGYSLNDTTTMAPVLLERHVNETRRQSQSLPTPTTPDIWKIYAKYPDALIGFVEIEIDQN